MNLCKNHYLNQDDTIDYHRKCENEEKFCYLS